ncbi:D-2-hydroxyacid dehydrogenase [Pseudalkalibacillus salsuginis]|uniref:D-2-hydroxyacid dehydrogenase n=1 Tax=Pseudalkalibacillus salsuginis TaxID=2910972 RepID=UPI001F48A365|nr:D-2-hydroxyacid dehydrogenase [Pseudalkalibacillus salsuginis]MCF6412014.1 D-2-hydroxyacid dehydrogenase [Pseudalkalibacillus salsuginis]
MFILSSGKVRYSIQDDVKEKYPDIRFQFCQNIKEAKEYIEDAEILLTYGEDLTAEIINKAHRLKWIHVMSAGLEKMPFEAIRAQDILVTNARGIHKIPMAEYTIGMMLQVIREFPKIKENQKNKVWDRKLQVSELYGKVIGVLGAGAIGSEIARLAKAFNMHTKGLNRSGRPVEHFDEMVTFDRLDDLLQKADFVVSVLPKTEETSAILKKGHFEKMQEHAVFINIGRGTTVDQKGLIEALQENQIAHAVLDVMEKEPLPEDSVLWGMENVTITPHLSGITPLYQRRAIDQFEENLKVYRTGEGDYLNKIDLTRGY